MAVLTDTRVRALKPLEAVYRVADSNGLALEVKPSGAKAWRYRYRFAAKANMLALGNYPEVSLSEARRRRDEARQLLERGIDPSAQRKATRAAQADSAANNFEAVAREWFEKNKRRWSDGNIVRTQRLLEKDLFPWIGRQPANEVSAPILLAALRRIEARGALETAHRARSLAGQIFRYAIATGRAERDPSADLRGALPPAVKQHFASIIEPMKVGELLRALHGYQGQAATAAALRLAPLVFVRPGNLRAAEWSEFDLDNAEWRIPASKMKSGRPHIVPLASQAVDILRELHPLTGRALFVFPGVRTPKRPMSENTVNAALRRLGYGTDDMTGHGFRHMASTLLHEQGFPHDAIERQLAHGERDEVSATYNWAEYLPERRRMMQAWADYLDGLRAGATVIPIRNQARG